MVDKLGESIKKIKKYTEDTINPSFNNTNDFPSRSDKVLIAQNNCIIQLLIEISEKLDILIKEKTKVLPDSEIDNLVDIFSTKLVLPKENQKKKKNKYSNLFVVENDRTSKQPK
jgi:hypothetical protein